MKSSALLSSGTTSHLHNGNEGARGNHISGLRKQSNRTETNTVKDNICGGRVRDENWKREGRKTGHLVSHQAAFLSEVRVSI